MMEKVGGTPLIYREKTPAAERVLVNSAAEVPS